MGKIREIRNVPQKEPGIVKRWFTDDDFWDIYVWTDDRNEIVGVQICYNRSYSERALTWLKGQVFDHTRVSPSYLANNRSGTPVLMPDGQFENNKILQKFLSDSTDMDKNLVSFIREKISEFKNS